MSLKHPPQSDTSQVLDCRVKKNKNFNMYLVYYHVVTKRMVSSTHALIHPIQNTNADLVTTLNVVKQHSDKAPTLLP